MRARSCASSRTLGHGSKSVGPIPALRILGASLRRETRGQLAEFAAIADAYPKSFMAQNRAAFQAWCDCDFNLAISYGERAERLEPNSFSTLMILAAAHIGRGNEEEAYAYAKRLLQAKRKDYVAWRFMRFLFAPFRSIPRVRNRIDYGFSQLTSTGDNWLAWARDFVAEYEARAKP